MSRRDVRNSLCLRNRFSRISMEPLEERRMLTTLTIYVDTFDDVVSPNDGKKSLREAIDEVNLGGYTEFIIELDAIDNDPNVVTPYTLTGAANEDNNATGDLDLKELSVAGVTVTIVGDGPEETVIDAGGLDRVFDLKLRTNLTLIGMTIQNGYVGTPYALSGGAVQVDSATFTAEDCWFIGNTARNTGGAISVGGSSSFDAHVGIFDSEFRNNVAIPTLNGNSLGGAVMVFDDAQVEIARSIFESNEATFGGAIDNFGANSTVEIDESTFVSNSAVKSTQNPSNSGGGAIRNLGSLHVTRSGRLRHAG